MKTMFACAAARGSMLLAAASGSVMCSGVAVAAPTEVPLSEIRPQVSRMASFDYIDGKYVRTSEWIVPGTTPAERGSGAIVQMYDALGYSLDDVDFDGVGGDLICGLSCGLAGDSSRILFQGLGGAVIDDFDVTDVGSNFEVDGFVVLTNLGELNCERLLTFFSVWDSVDATGAGFDTDGDGTPDDAIDRGPGGSAMLMGGVVMEWNTSTCPDTDFDGVPDGFSASAFGGSTLFSTGNSLILNGTSFPTPASGTGAFEFIIASDYIDTDMDGVADSPVPRPNADVLLFGTDEEQLLSDGMTIGPGTPGCTGRPGLSSSALWASPTMTFGPGTFNELDSVAFGSSNLCPDPLSAAITVFAEPGPPSCRLSCDCNGNGITDSDDIASGLSQDLNADGIPDECIEGRNRPCGDVNGNGVSPDPADFTAWLGFFNNPGSAGSYRADVNNNGLSQDPPDFTAWLGYFNNPASDPSDCLD